jgi:methylmalonyl-CoA mutase cobalamin-binding domain/chain
LNSSGKILLGTVAGDIHDIGKNIAATLLSCHGFTVIDLGIDVPHFEFARKAVEINPDIVGLSGLITASFDSMKETISILRAESQIHKLDYKILVGGGIVDQQVSKYVGADSWTNNAMSGVRICQRFMKNKSLHIV